MSMRLTPALLQATADALSRLLEPAGPADALLHQYFREQRQLGQRERAFVAETCFGVLRHLLTLRELLGKRSPRRVMLAYLARWGGTSLRDLEPCLRGDEAQWLASLKATTHELSLAARTELPEWLLERMLKSSCFRRTTKFSALPRSSSTTGGGGTFRRDTSRSGAPEWAPWGLYDVTAGRFVDAAYDPAHEDYSRWSATAFKEWYLPKFQKLRVDVNYLNGSNLDRFSQYAFTQFGR